MKRWIRRVLLLAAAIAALTVGAMAEEVILDGIKYDGGTVVGPVNATTITTARIAAEINGVKITQIQDDAFTGCARLTSVEIGSNVTTIGSSAFNSCPVLETVLFSDSVISIGKHAFANCGKLNKVVMPSALKKIEEGTFSNCGSLSSIYIAAVSEIDWDAFSGTKVTCLHSATGDSVTQQDSPALEVHRASQTPGIPTEPTCTEPGSREYTYNCNTCGTSFNFTQNRPIPPKGHSEETDPFEGKPATCTEPGYEAGARCSVCKEIVEGGGVIDIKPDAHPEGAIQPIEEKEATCTEPGLSGGERCIFCGEITTEQTETEAKGHDMVDLKKKGPWEITEDSTCTEKGSQRRQIKECSVCKEPEYEIKTVKVKGHSYVLTETSRVIEYDCINGHISVKDWICERCGDKKQYFELCKDEDGNEIPGHEESAEIDEEYLTHLIAVHGAEKGEPGDHTPPADAEYVVDLEATCTTTGLGRYVGGYTCTVCEEHITDEDGEDKTVELPLMGHNPVSADSDEEAIIKAPDCETAGERWEKFYRCSRCNEPSHSEETVTISALGHNWGDFTPVNGVMPAQAEDCSDTPVEGYAFCTRCGHKSDTLEFTIPGKLSHIWEWVPNADGETETLTCRNCKKEDETRAISNSGGADDNNTGGDGSGGGNTGNGGGEGSGGTGAPAPDTTSYRVDVIQASNGTVSASLSSATAGTSVTLTVSPGSGYELDMLRVTTSTSVVSATSLSGGRYRFTMPAANVEVRVSFVRKAASSSSNWTGASSSSSSQATAQAAVQSVPKLNASGQLFSDIPASHWAAGEINWANQMGYMNGTANGFNPNGNITFQQMWMVMARLTGSRPSSMADARRWAVNGGFADGSAPEGSVTRQQLVTALYRCAHLMGTSNRNTTTLAGFPDSRTVSSVAREPFAWAVANGIIGGNSNGRLDPNGTLTRAQFAVILYRFSQRV